MDRPKRRYSASLLGQTNPGCVIPGCASTLRTTGWLEYSEAPIVGWYLEFECPEHGLQLTGGGPWQALIDAALGNVR